MAVYEHTIADEVKVNLTRPWRLPRNMAIAALFTFAGIAISITIHRFRRGLPYIAADLFIWTLATYNVSQLGSDPTRVLRQINKKAPLKEVFFIKNMSLVVFALPIDLALIVIACALLNDWSKFWLAIVLGVSVAIIGLGLGNLASVIWAYQPGSLWKLRKDRVKIFEYAVFIAATYITATLALLLATIPAWFALKVLGTNSAIKILIGLMLVAVWSVGIWLMAASYADGYAAKHPSKFIKHLNGDRLDIRNHQLKKLLKAY